MAADLVPALTRVAQYVRMSTEHQKYSVARQSAAIEDYATRRGYQIVRRYADEGVSGLGIDKREGLKRLLGDVIGGVADYELVLVYDVSRWGRFQDPDQSAHYEFICRQAGVRVEYCAEPFDNDGSIGSVLLKSLKRVMAAEFSRELSQRTSASQRRSASLGYWVGGPAGYGLRRQAVRHDGQRGRILERGDQKGLSERSILVPGPAEEVATVRRIFRLFVIGGLSTVEIARTLNAEGCTAEFGARWTKFRVRQLLGNEKYIGANIFGRTRSQLGQVRRLPLTNALRMPDAFEPIVAPRMFEAAARYLRKRRPKPHATDAEMLANLSALLAQTGYLSAAVIDRSDLTHAAETYKLHFGTLMRAYALVGYRPTERQKAAARRIRARRPHLDRNIPPPLSDEEMLSALAALYAREGRLSTALINSDPTVPKAFRYGLRFGGMRHAYALVGYLPNHRLQRVLESRNPQSISIKAAEALAARVPPGGYLLPDAEASTAPGEA